MSHRTQSLPIPTMPRTEVKTMETNTDLHNYIGITNTEMKKSSSVTHGTNIFSGS